MILIRAALIRLAKIASIFVLSSGVLGCFLLSYAYVAGDRADREDMQATIAHVTDGLRLVPDAQAESSQPKTDSDL